jgi:hypothetical protein
VPEVAEREGFTTEAQRTRRGIEEVIVVKKRLAIREPPPPIRDSPIRV